MGRGPDDPGQQQAVEEAAHLDSSRKLFSYRELSSNRELAGLLNEARALRARPGNPRLTGLPKEAAEVGLRLAEFESLATGSAFRVIANPRASDAQWLSVPGTSEALVPLRAAFKAGDASPFAKEASALKTKWSGHRAAISTARLEDPARDALPAGASFPIGMGLLCGCGDYLAAYRPEPGRLCFSMAARRDGFLLQAAGFATRVAIAGRPPVTNIYESVVWVAFGTVLFALIFEGIYRSRYFLLAATPVAVVSLILADTQTLALNRSINPLVPVLRDNFWLTTHVLTITLSYAAFALALGIGHIALGKVIRGRRPEATLYNYLYRTLQVGVLLLATGTILGGVWANYSWGRFWDWDPKETWALVTLLAYLFVLHGRIAGKWAGFGMAVGSVLAFQGVLMAWYGVNFVLGVGLHSYGFGTGGFGWALLSSRRKSPLSRSPSFGVVALPSQALRILRSLSSSRSRRNKRSRKAVAVAADPPFRYFGERYPLGSISTKPNPASARAWEILPRIPTTKAFRRGNLHARPGTGR